MSIYVYAVFAIISCHDVKSQIMYNET